MLKSRSAGHLTGRCPLCNARVDSGQGLCSRCFHKRGAQWLVVGMVVAVGGAYAYASMRPSLPSLITMDDHTTQAVVPMAPYREKAWEYSVTVDPLIGDSTLHAKVIGTGPFADNQSQLTSLELTESQQYGKSVTVAFPKVPEACQANPCTVSLAWDQAPPDQYRYQEVPSIANNRTVLRLDEYGRFMDALAKAHRLKVMAAFGTANDYVVTFPVEGFDPKKAQRNPRRPPADQVGSEDAAPLPAPANGPFGLAPTPASSVQPDPGYTAKLPGQTARRG